MTLSGTQDSGLAGEPPSWRLEAFRNMPPGDKYQVLVEGARHLSFAVGGRPCVVRETIAFWDSYLKHGSHGAAPVSAGACVVTSK
jgi:hypothetical protein